MFLEIEPDETSFEVLAEKRTSLGDSPFNARSGDGDLDVEGVRDSRKKINQLTYWWELAFPVLGDRGIKSVPIFAVFAFANAESTARLVLINSASSDVRLSVP